MPFENKSKAPSGIWSDFEQHLKEFIVKIDYRVPLDSQNKPENAKEKIKSMENFSENKIIFHRKMNFKSIAQSLLQGQNLKPERLKSLYRKEFCRLGEIEFSLAGKLFAWAMSELTIIDKFLGKSTLYEMFFTFLEFRSRDPTIAQQQTDSLQILDSFMVLINQFFDNSLMFSLEIIGKGINAIKKCSNSNLSIPSPSPNVTPVHSPLKSTPVNRYNTPINLLRSSLSKKFVPLIFLVRLEMIILEPPDHPEDFPVISDRLEKVDNIKTIREFSKAQIDDHSIKKQLLKRSTLKSQEIPNVIITNTKQV